MKIRYSNLGDNLYEFVQQTSHELWLVAPFIKFQVIEKILKDVHAEIKIICVTRWHPQEIAAGVSDIDIWPYLAERSRTSLWLRQNLHAKYYRSDNRCLIGSANLTMSALGWHSNSNLELLYPIDFESNEVKQFEESLLSHAVQVTDMIYQNMLEAIQSIPKQTLSPPPQVSLDIESTVATSDSGDEWLPSLRYPDSLFDAYIGNWDRLSTHAQVAAYKDLQALMLPLGLDKNSFNKTVAALLVQQPIVQIIDSFVSKPQRFGAVKHLVSTHYPDIDANFAWQTLMRWLLYFLPERYTMTTPNYSEVFSRRY